MGKCPKCGEEITYLKNFCYNSTVIYRFSVTPDGLVSFDDVTMNDYDDEEFWCPRCDEVLASDEDKAKAILEGKA